MENYQVDGQASYFLTVFLGFFAIMNPLTNAPIFLSLTEGLTPGQRRAVALKSPAMAFFIVALFMILGNVVFNLFDITLPAFRISGGILIFLVGYQLLHGKTSKIHHPDQNDESVTANEANEIAMSPLAVPILAGPGTIATGMGYAANEPMTVVILTLIALAIVSALVAVAFLAAGSVLRVLGHNKVRVVGQLMGMILTFIGVQMFILGVAGAIQMMK